MNKKKIITIVVIVCLIITAIIGGVLFFINHDNVMNHKDGKNEAKLATYTDENGLYKNLDKYSLNLPEQKEDLPTVDLKNVLSMMDEKQKDNKTWKEDILTEYCWYSGIGGDTEHEIEKDNLVVCEVTVTENDQPIFENEKRCFIAGGEGKPAKSLLDHEIGDSYTVKFTTDDNGTEIVSKVEMKILYTYNSKNFLTDKFVKTHKDDFKIVNENIKDLNSYFDAMTPYLVEPELYNYIIEKLKNADVSVPEEFIENELAIYKEKIKNVGYTYDQYLEITKNTNEDIVNKCKQTAKYRYIIMKIHEKYFGIIEEKDLPQEALENSSKYDIIDAKYDVMETHVVEMLMELSVNNFMMEVNK